MDREEFERIKAAEKEHLRRLRELKGTLRALEQKRRIAGALEDMRPDDLLRRHEEAVERLSLDALESEARLDMALEAAGQRPIHESPAPAPAEPDEEGLRKARAEALVRQLRGELGTEAAGAPASSPQPQSSPAPPPPTGEALPEKTIGRMKPRQSPTGKP